MDSREQTRRFMHAWTQLCEREAKVGFAHLRPAEQVIFAVGVLESEVNNGGIHQYLFNSSGDRAVFVLSALRTIGANGHADLCEAFFTSLPGGSPSAVWDDRQEQLEEAENAMGEDVFEAQCAVIDERFYAADGSLEDQIFAYMQAHGIA